MSEGCTKDIGETTLDTKDIHLLRFDGGSRGNPGPSGAGAILFLPTGAVLHEDSVFAGPMATNNEAEYLGLITGLTTAVGLGITRLCVEGDSLLVINQVQDKWRVKAAHLAPLVEQCKVLASRFAFIQFEHIPRAKNKDADRLANLAMDIAAKK